ncbi:MAG: capsule biosynthesis protein CapA [Pseudomonadota bacterium]
MTWAAKPGTLRTNRRWGTMPDGRDMGNQIGEGRTFLFLQGPHGPFFWRLAQRLRRTGATCLRVGFNWGDRVFWPERGTFLPHKAGIEAWPAAFDSLADTHGITDLVLYGDTRPVHALAIARAKAQGITVHVFEEGYLRPWWITYERGGANGHSPVMRMSIDDIRSAQATQRHDPVEAPDRWGEMRQHVVYGAAYHAMVLAGGGNWAMAPHRALSVQQEFALYLRRLAFMPAHWAARTIATVRIKLGAYPFHLCLLQLDHDASLRHHGAFASTSAFLRHVIDGFAKGAPSHHHLVMKAHPLEDGRVPQRRLIARYAKAAGIADRVHYVRGGKLALLLGGARSVVTVNSTAAQQALWRGLPVRAFGAAVYAKPELTSDQGIEAYFANPQPPDRAAYADFRQFLLETSQITGGYYSARGRRRLYRQLPDLMLAATDRYAHMQNQGAAQAQHLKLIAANP